MVQIENIRAIPRRTQLWQRGIAVFALIALPLLPVLAQPTSVYAVNDITITQSGGNTRVNESGSTDTFTAVLSHAPASNVVITVTSSDVGEVTAAPSSLTFTAANWNAPQTVTVTGVDDTIIDGTQTTSVVLSVVDAH